MPRTKEQFEEIRKRTKLKILENALELFAEKGFKGTSISEIAKSAGVSKGLAYNYFKDKNELMVSVLGLLSRELENAFVTAKNMSDPSEKLKLLIDETFRQIKYEAKFWRLYMNFALSPEIQKEADKFFSEFLEKALSDIELIFIKLNYPRPSYESKIFGALLDGICFHYLFDKQKYPLEKMHKYLLSKYCKNSN
jgi:AcrR family transcriptional regulator